MKALENIDRIQLTKEVILLLVSLYESKGKTFYYNELFSRDLQSFERKTKELNMINIAKIFKLNLTSSRIKLLARKDIVAKTKDEHLFNNIKLALDRLHNNPENFELLVNEIESLLKVLSKNSDSINFNTYEHKGDALIKSRRRNKREDLEQLIELFDSELRSKKFELTQLITNFYVDFINMEIVNPNNDLVALIILYALLIKNFNVFHYVSFFKYFNDSFSKWEQALVQAAYYWSSGFSQTEMLSRVLLEMLIQIYEEIDDIAHEYKFEKDLNKSDSIENSILKMTEVFSKEDIRKRHPNVSDATINRTLKRLKEENIIIPLGKGRSSKWQRIVKGHEIKNIKQLSIFND